MAGLDGWLARDSWLMGNREGRAFIFIELILQLDYILASMVRNLHVIVTATYVLGFGSLLIFLFGDLFRRVFSFRTCKMTIQLFQYH